MCASCGLSPCACSYIKTLLPGGRNAWLADTVKQMARQPQPHRGGEGSCPCPACYSQRLASWGER